MSPAATDRSTGPSGPRPGAARRIARAAVGLFVLGLVALPATGLFGQEVAEDRSEDGMLRVFFDCGTCDFDYVRRSIRFVSWVRDRVDAQVHVLVTTRSAGAGGTEYTLSLTGRDDFRGVEDRVRLRIDPTDTEHEIRDRVTHALELALAGFTAGSELGRGLQVEFRPDSTVEEARAVELEDPWRAWLFSVGVDGFVSGQEGTRSASIRAALGARHTSEAWKVRLSVSGDYLKDRFELSGDEELVSSSKSVRSSLLVVRSVSARWSMGARSSIRTSTFSNTDHLFRFAPAVEYGVFPYDESSERSFRLQYSVGIQALNYTEETIFGVTAETLYDHSLVATLDLVRPWGSAQLSAELSALLDDTSQYRASVNAGTDWRIVRGLSLFLLGNVARLADQRSIPAAGASDAEILLRRRELQTTFDYSLSMGLAFTFGSRFVNIVNPRFGN